MLPSVLWKLLRDDKVDAFVGFPKVKQSVVWYEAAEKETFLWYSHLLAVPPADLLFKSEVRLNRCCIRHKLCLCVLGIREISKLTASIWKKPHSGSDTRLLEVFSLDFPSVREYGHIVSNTPLSCLEKMLSVHDLSWLFLAKALVLKVYHFYWKFGCFILWDQCRLSGGPWLCVLGWELCLLLSCRF